MVYPDVRLSPARWTCIVTQDLVVSATGDPLIVATTILETPEIQVPFHV
jgi:hypothetical protein